MKLFNFLTRKIEIFRPYARKTVRIYACGPTVYNFAHIGNLRTYVFEDILRRVLKINGWKVKTVMNITDVEDKIIREAKKSGRTIFEFVHPYEKAFFEDLEKLNIEPADKYPKATKHIKEMVSLINKLLHRGIAYECKGSIYFDISKFSVLSGKKYGRLSRLDKNQFKSGARIDADEYEKKQAEDFVLWKASKKNEPSWPADFRIGGRTAKLAGRPGWHIECSAMSMKYLGNGFDIHAGGVDLLFPHHENEIAQSEGATGKTFARFFVEGEHLMVDGKKMSKSLGNLYTLRNVEKKGYNPIIFRYLVLGTHYRSKLNFTWKSLESSKNALERIKNRVLELKQSRKKTGTNKKVSEKFRQEFEKHAFNDLDIPKALAVFWKHFDSLLLEDFFWADQIFGLNLRAIKQVKEPVNVRNLIKKREKYRKDKEWEKADKLREQIKKLGWSVKDTPDSTVVKPL